ncbi:MAG: S41 family peptidase [Clostridia bacterium]|nr:S41 family peptidase [Clostridia bacterium]
MKNKVFLWLMSIILTIALSVTSTLAVVKYAEVKNPKYVIEFNQDEVEFSSIKVFNEVVDYLKNEYIDEVDMNKAVISATAGVVASVDDPFTMYVPKEYMESMMEKSEGNYIGIGVVITNPTEGRGTLITTVYPDGPANQSGVLPGDLILKVDDEDVSGITDLSYIASIVKGEKGTDVTINVYRAIEDRYIDFTITRDEVNSIEVEGRIEEGNIGYIKIISFSQDSAVEFINVLKDLISQGMENLVLDLRDNGGGDYSAILNIANLFIDGKLITYTIDKNGKKDEQYARSGSLGMPMVVMVNGYSASASEMLTGALKDYKIATVIGETTYGKGSVQAVHKLSDGSGLRVTIAKYYTPNGVCIHGIGIEPDETILPEDDYINYPTSLIPREDDVVLDRAIEILKGN